VKEKINMEKCLHCDKELPEDNKFMILGKSVCKECHNKFTGAVDKLIEEIKPPEDCCENCVHGKCLPHLPENSRLCRESSPQIIMKHINFGTGDITHASWWPVVDKSECCGKHKRQ
jgi:hypothetical protein